MPKEDSLGRIESKMDVLIKLIAIQAIGDTNQSEAIQKLSKLGLDRNTIATILGTSPLTVSVRLSEARKKGKKR